MTKPKGRTQQPAATIAQLEAQIAEAKAQRHAFLEKHAVVFAEERTLAEQVHALVEQLGARHREAQAASG